MNSQQINRDSQTEAQLRRDALSIFRSALAAADASAAVRHAVVLSDGVLTIGNERFEMPAFRRVWLLAVGKAAVPMAVVLEELLGDSLTAALVVTKYEHAAANRGLRSTTVLESGHPIPDEAGERAARAVREFVRGIEPEDLLLVTISGGASALLPAPVSAITLQEKRATTALLLKAGADIFELNCVRKHLSTLKGGWLAKLAYPGTVISLLLSDVIGDRLDVIGSGLTAPDESTFDDALQVLARFDLIAQVPRAVRTYIETGAAGLVRETPKRDDPVFERVHHFVVASNRIALEAAAAESVRMGYHTLILSSSLAGEAKQVAGVHAQILAEISASGHPVARPACILSGGETTVTVRGDGKGGRNQEFALASAIGIAGLQDVALLSAGTDGSDGPTDAAGAFVTGTTCARADQQALDPADFLVRNDSYTFFDALDDLVRTGPTGTNVMDVNILLAR